MERDAKVPDLDNLALARALTNEPARSTALNNFTTITLHTASLAYCPFSALTARLSKKEKPDTTRISQPDLTERCSARKGNVSTSLVSTSLDDTRLGS